MVIVGAGQAGGRAAMTLREQGHEGPVVLIGAEPEAPYERPPLSKAYLKGERAGAEFTFAPAEALAAAGIEFRAGIEVEAIDRKRKRVRLGDGSEIGYAKLLLATGRKPRRLPLPDDLAERVHVLRDLRDAARLRQVLVKGARLAIVGGGFIGLEVAASAAALGAEVTVLEMAPRLLSRGVPVPLAAALLARHVEAGVAVLVARQLEDISVSPGGVVLRMADGGRIEADSVLVGIGAEPRTALAERAGLAVDRGILVDAMLATSDADIFAAGDVCAFPHPLAPDLLRLESWKNADAQGALAARNMLGAAEIYRELPWFWSDQYELTLQIAGFPEQAERVVERDAGSGARLLFHLDGTGRLVAVSGIGPASLARDLRIGQLMVERGLSPDSAALADPATKLKSLLPPSSAAMMET
jgi:3-phenylpropionate/trans-cinnamate dioxygenase ferredoxin reductase subunit